MVLFNYSTKELTAKVVYYGPALCGKTSNLQWIHEKVPIKNKGKMLSLATETDRTLFFDFLPIEIGAIRGMRTRIQLYTVPGQVFYNATRRMVLKGADAVVFVCDSQEPMLDANLESLENMRQNLEANEISVDEIPIVFQFNKRDLPNALPIEILNERLNTREYPFYEAIAPKGVGVEDTLKAVTKLVFRSLSARYGDAAGVSSPTRSSASGGPRPGSLPGGEPSRQPLPSASGEFLTDLSFTPQPRVAAPPVSRPAVPIRTPTPVRTPAPAVGRATPAPAARPATPPGLAASLVPSAEDLTMPSPSMHSESLPPPKPGLGGRSPQQTLISTASEADELRRRIAAPGVRQEEEDLELEEIDLEDSLPMPQPLPPDPEPSETIAPTGPRVVTPPPPRPSEIEVPIEVQVPPGATRVQIKLRLVLNLRR
jgi:signal recognition particle receptor subunit beta